MFFMEYISVNAFTLIQPCKMKVVPSLKVSFVCGELEMQSYDMEYRKVR